MENFEKEVLDRIENGKKFSKEEMGDIIELFTVDSIREYSGKNNEITNTISIISLADRFFGIRYCCKNKGQYTIKYEMPKEIYHCGYGWRFKDEERCYEVV